VREQVRFTEERAMDLKLLILLTLQVSTMAIVFGFGLKCTVDDLLYLVRRPALLTRTVLAMFVLMPLVAILLAEIFGVVAATRVALIALVVAPIPPLLPNRQAKIGGRPTYAIALMATVAVLSIVTVPLSVRLFSYYFERELDIETSAVAGIVFKTALAPLLAGMAVRFLSARTADRIEPYIAKGGKILLMSAGLVLLTIAAPAMWALVGNGTVLAIVLFLVIGLAIGHVLGGPDPDGRAILALSTACRHPAIAIAIAVKNFPDQQFGALIVLYLLLSLLVGVPYTLWQQRRAAAQAALPASAPIV
jgi:BASS family bile acid:Na+ symporter